jgi:hypothetical protein
MSSHYTIARLKGGNEQMTDTKPQFDRYYFHSLLVYEAADTHEEAA